MPFVRLAVWPTARWDQLYAVERPTSDVSPSPWSSSKHTRGCWSQNLRKLGASDSTPTPGAGDNLSRRVGWLYGGRCYPELPWGRRPQFCFTASRPPEPQERCRQRQTTPLCLDVGFSIFLMALRRVWRVMGFPWVVVRSRSSSFLQQQAAGSSVDQAHPVEQSWWQLFSPSPTSSHGAWRCGWNKASLFTAWGLHWA